MTDAATGGDPVVFRSRLLCELRSFFYRAGYIEAVTPTLVWPPALETHIDAIAAGDGWLRTSPELHMKRLMALGHQRIFQIGPCYRAEERGRRHRCEFTMLEWYVAGEDYRQLRTFTELLLQHVASALRPDGVRYQGRSLDFNCPRPTRTVAEAFAEFADCTPEAAIADETFDLMVVDRIEPQLGAGGPEFLQDYPAALGALARLSPTNPAVAERWELYIAGLELANAYSELIDPLEQRARFTACAAERAALGREVYPIDEAFLAAMPHMPTMAGCALGVDRLHMILANADDIADVLPFP